MVAQLAVRVLPAHAAVVQDDLSTFDVVSEPESTQSETVLTTFAAANCGKLLDVLLAPKVVGVGLESTESFGVDPWEIGMLNAQAVEQTIELGYRANREMRRHVFRRR